LSSREIALASLGLAAGLGLAAAAFVFARLPPVGNRAVPDPKRDVDLGRYAGAWFELARYDNSFERGLDYVRAEYRIRDDGQVEVLNRARDRASGRVRIARGLARVVAGSQGAKLKVSFFGPFFLGDYWVLDHDPDYAWSIVGEPSGRFLWILHRLPCPGDDAIARLVSQAASLGYEIERLRFTHQ
jgi:apolipoprotein D and lipocalin family protein